LALPAHQHHSGRTGRQQHLAAPAQLFRQIVRQPLSDHQTLIAFQVDASSRFRDGSCPEHPNQHQGDRQKARQHSGPFQGRIGVGSGGLVQHHQAQSGHS